MDSTITRAEHNEFVRRMTDEHNRMNHRINTLERSNAQLQELVSNVGKMAVNMEHMLDEQRAQSERLERLEAVPNQSWNTLKNSVLSAVGATLGGAIIAALLFFM